MKYISFVAMLSITIAVAIYTTACVDEPSPPPSTSPNPERTTTEKWRRHPANPDITNPFRSNP
jgi:PBP1b-binding outer membrane lipoprotein LpoB